ncbi:MAG: hypothetical protein KDC73_09165 [Ignavibacteriae bacterium]|nr:hypothetical protein [Ignavibacteriota bacterium]MCB9242121.1 hypothetical protein [Ignavibacteriales bacterium]
MKAKFGFLVLLFLGLSLCSCNKDEGNDVTGTQSGGNHNPNTPSDPNPSDAATGVNRNLTLSWNCSDPDPSDTVSYDIYAGISNPPNTIISNEQLSKTLYVGIVAANTKFYWKVVAKDNHGLYTDGPIWSFTTSP